MLTTCFVAALLHGIVILGVTFSSPYDAANGGRRGGSGGRPGQRSGAERRRKPECAIPVAAQPAGIRQYLKRERTLIPKSSPMPVDRVGIPDGDGAAAAAIRRATSATTSWWQRMEPAAKILYFAAAERQPTNPPQLPLLLEKRPDFGMASNDDGVELRMRGEAKTAAVDRRRHPRIGRCRVPGRLASQDRASGHHEFPGCRAAREALGNAGDRGDDRRRRQTAANRDPPQQRPRGNRRGRHADFEARRPLRPLSERHSAPRTIRSASPTNGNFWVVRRRAPAYFIRTRTTRAVAR